MACDRTKVLANQGECGLSEDAAIKPTTKEAKKNAKKNNEYQFAYGGGKLDCEFCLGGEGGPSLYTILRLPDVIGPWDNLGSQMRLQQDLIDGTPVGTKIGAVCGRISIIGATDVSRAILAVLHAPQKANGRTLHIACSEKATFEQYVRLVAGHLGVEPVLDPHLEADMVTVDIGPISNAAALATLEWTPTSLSSTVQHVVEWYRDQSNRQYTAALVDSSASSSSSSSSEHCAPQGGNRKEAEVPVDTSSDFRFNF